MINASLRDEVTGGLARRKGLKVSDDGCSNMLTVLWQVSYPSPAANSSVALRVVDEKIKELFEQFGLEHLLQLYGFDAIRSGWLTKLLQLVCR